MAPTPRETIVTETTDRPTKAGLKLLKQQVDLDLKKAELAKATAEAKKAQLDTEARELDIEGKRRLEEHRKAREDFDTTFRFDDEVHSGSVEIFVSWLRDIRQRKPDLPLTIYMDSPGGSVYDGFTMMDSIKEACDAGADITVKMTGMAASMAGIIAQSATRRLIGKHSWLMIHTITSASFGFHKSFEIADKDEYVRRLTKKALEAYSERSDKWTSEELFEKVHVGRKDWWLDAEEAVAEGFADGLF